MSAQRSAVPGPLRRDDCERLRARGDLPGRGGGPKGRTGLHSASPRPRPARGGAGRAAAPRPSPRERVRERRVGLSREAEGDRCPPSPRALRQWKRAQRAPARRVRGAGSVRREGGARAQAPEGPRRAPAPPRNRRGAATRRPPPSAQSAGAGGDSPGWTGTRSPGARGPAWSRAQRRGREAQRGRGGARRSPLPGPCTSPRVAAADRAATSRSRTLVP